MSPEISLLTINIVLGLVVAAPLAWHLKKSVGKGRDYRFYFMILIAAYLVESVALIVGMGIPVLNLFLAGLWGFLIDRWFARRITGKNILRTTIYLAAYSCLPALSFLAIPVLVWISGGSVLSSEAGLQFGIPAFLPSFMQTLLGFYLSVYIGTALVKILVTTSIVTRNFSPRKKALFK